jgi:hypothetical protein
MLLPIEPQTSQRRAQAMEGYQAFRRSLHPYVSEAILRDQTELPPDFVAWAPGVVVASDHLLRAAGWRPGARRPPGWRKGKGLEDTFFNDGEFRLMVRGCGEFWTVERDSEIVLVFRFGFQPVFTRTVEGAMYLGEACRNSFRNSQPKFSELQWIPWTPDGIHFC